MANIRENNKKSTPYLDTLAQLAPKARAKYLTNALVYRLVDQNSPLRKSYWNTYHCASVYKQTGKTLTTTYCNNRWCLICNRIRIAKMILGYLPVIKKFVDAHAMVLTIPNVPADQLKDTIDDMIKTFRNIVHSWNTHHKENKMIGIRKIECTYNEITDTYHPHFHIIVDGWQAANTLRKQWLERYKKASINAQWIKQADINSLIELFKYFTKILVKSKKTGLQDFFAPQMDIIFQAMRKRRVYQPFGGIRMINEDIETESQEYAELANEDKVWTWMEHDWVDENTGETLTGYEPSDNFKELVDRISQKK